VRQHGLETTWPAGVALILFLAGAVAGLIHSVF